jgi:hypothetical protein
VPKTLRWARVAAERVDVKAGCVKITHCARRL